MAIWGYHNVRIDQAARLLQKLEEIDKVEVKYVLPLGPGVVAIYTRKEHEVEVNPPKTAEVVKGVK